MCLTFHYYLFITRLSLHLIVDGDAAQYKVTYSNGESDTYDTVLCAIGRHADTAKLDLESLGMCRSFCR